MFRRKVKYILELNPDHEVMSFATGRECLDNLRLKPDIISLDYTLPDMSGTEVLRKIKHYNPEVAVIILSGQEDIGTAVQLLREGAYDYIVKDEDTKDRVLNALAHIKREKELRREVIQLKEALKAKYQFGNMILGSSKAIQKVFSLMEKAVQSNITVSVTGETGAGKELVAKSIHYNSPRRKGPFVAVNMGAIPRDLLESELFGYEKGAFTGAAARKKGQFELADQGTLFLDEIADIDMTLQVKLLRALQERSFIRLGGTKMISFDARIIIASHKDLAEEVRRGRFREDLYYRLLGLNIQLPPLRERGKDIILLAQHFLKEAITYNNLPERHFSKEAKEKLLSYHYPGNVRELKAIVEVAAVMAGGDLIGPGDIEFRSPNRTIGFLNEEMTLEAYKRKIIFHYLEKYDRDVLLVARKLDIGKSTIYRMLKEQ